MKNSQHLADPWVQPSFKTFESHESCIFCAEGLRVRSERSQKRERERKSQSQSQNQKITVRVGEREGDRGNK